MMSELNPPTLQAVGEALYGWRWRSPLARDLDVAVRTVQRWRAGDRAIPATLADDLRSLLEENKMEIERLLTVIN
jgi:hypothetical protein